ncbi:MAG TPA: Gfo/Idh/MocA family oxidoreductase, partial [Planctomycetaceae bacterium]|nr:Gfo/Idh/MocA family oxidoreductase [Planctomycetaceae bacterium]
MKNSPISRRDFVRTGVAASVTAAAPMVVSAKVKGANERIGVGFIGTGGRCRAHINIVNKLTQQGLTQPVAVCDVYRPRLEEASKLAGGAKMYMEHEALLDHPGVDVVCIATPDRLHAPQTIDALKAGKDVYCEKPLTLTLNE